MSDTEYIKNIRLLNLINSCKKQSRSHNRLPFGPNDTDIILDNDTVERRNRARMLAGIAKVMETNELKKLGITDEGHELTTTDLFENKINDIQTKLTTQININSAYQTERATALAAMGALTTADITIEATKCNEQKHDAQSETQSLLQITNSLIDAITIGDEDGKPVDWIDRLVRECDEGELNTHTIDKLRPFLAHLVSLLAKLDDSPILKKLNLDRYDNLLTSKMDC